MSTTSPLIGITAEWNPFHAGHAAMIDTIKKAHPKASLIAIMSGAFVQRGEPALFDKWTRAGWAVRAGVDAVFEFPALYALQSADHFSRYAASLLHAMGAHMIAFGAESLTKDELLTAARWAISEDYEHLLHERIAAGLSYGEAAHETMAAASPYLAGELTKPNNLLGFRYTETILRNHYDMDILVIPRDMEHPVSATSARRELLSQKRTVLLSPAAEEEAAQLMEEGRYTDPSRYEDCCHLLSRLMPREALQKTGLFKEGLEYKWEKESQRISYEEMLAATKSKRYLRSSLKRLGAELLLSPAALPSPFLAPPDPSYARLLALRREKSALLRNLPLPIITSTAKALKTLPEEAAAMLEMDLRASDVQSFCQAGVEYRKGKMDFYTSPVMVD